MKYYLDDKLLFIDMRQHYTHAVCIGDRVICCQKNELDAQAVCRELIEDKQKFMDELLAALNSDEVYSRGGYRYTDEAKRQHISDIKSRYRTSGEIHNAVARVRKSIESVCVRALTVRA